jgi:hypothetical protein
MTVLIAVPVYRIACRVAIAKGRGWSVVEELVLWAMTRQAKSLPTLAADAGLPQQIVTAAVSRLMASRRLAAANRSHSSRHASTRGRILLSSACRASSFRAATSP